MNIFQFLFIFGPGIFAELLTVFLHVIEFVQIIYTCQIYTFSPSLVCLLLLPFPILEKTAKKSPFAL